MRVLKLFAVSPRVTPDPAAAAALERSMQQLQYQPTTAFHRDRLQSRVSSSEAPQPRRRRHG